MQSHLKRNVYWRPFLLVAFSCLILVACGSDAEEESLPEGCDGVTWGSDIQVEEKAGEYVAAIRGDYPDSCSTICGSEQTVSGNTINIDLYSSKPQDLLCVQQLTPFVTEITLDVEGLDPGEYTVTLNETHRETTFLLE